MSANASGESSSDGSAGVGASGSTTATAATFASSSSETAAATSSAAFWAPGAPPSGAPGSVVAADTGGWSSTWAVTATRVRPAAVAGSDGAWRRAPAGAAPARASSRSIRASSALTVGS